MAVTKNTWNKGLNSDLSKLKTQQDSYLDAKNIRVITDTGESTFAIENVRGNKYSFKIPKVEKTYGIDFTGQTQPVQIVITRTIVNVQVSFTVSVAINLNFSNLVTLSNEDIVTIINDEIKTTTNDPSLRDYVKAYYNSDEVVIYDFLPPDKLNNWSSISITLTGGLTSRIRSKETTNHTILGWGYYNDNLVLITCDENSNSLEPENEPPNVNTDGFIWDIKFNNQTNEPVNLIPGTNDILPYNPINNEYTLKYAGALSLSRYYAINKHLKCRYESTEKTRLAWTDWHNNLRICNIADPQIWATSPGLFSYLPAHVPQKPVVKGFISGSTLPTGKYQYFYLLSTNQGAESTISVLSNLVNVYNGNGISYDNVGQKAGDNSSTSISINISDLDTNYDTIRIGYVIYQAPNFAEAFWIAEKALPDSGNFNYIHNGNEDEVPIDDITTLANLNRSPEIFKTIDVVRNRLIAANAITKYFDLEKDFDAKAYRYNSNKVADLYNEDDLYGSSSVKIDRTTSPGVYGTIDVGNQGPVSYATKQAFYNALIQLPDIYDYINPFNIESNDLTFNKFSGPGPGVGDWSANCQFKFKEDGTTIGGEGPNISYEFVLQTNVPDTRTFQRNKNFINPAKNNVADYDNLVNNQLIPGFNDNKKYPGGNGAYLDSHKSSVFETLFTGYSRGEVYRWGIVFHDLYGFPSYVQWIADIKFPFASDNNGDFGLTDDKIDVPNLKLASFPESQVVNAKRVRVVTPAKANIGSLTDYMNLSWEFNTFKFYVVNNLGVPVLLKSNGSDYKYIGYPKWLGGPGVDIDALIDDFNKSNVYFIASNGTKVTVRLRTIGTVGSGHPIQFYYETYDPIATQYKLFIIRTTPKIKIGNFEFAPWQPIIGSEKSIYFDFPPNYGTNLPNNIVTKQLGIKFKLDTSTDQFKKIKDKISGWSYVRVKRNIDDSTRLGTGVLMPSVTTDSFKNLFPIALYVDRYVKNFNKTQRNYWFAYYQGDLSDNGDNYKNALLSSTKHASYFSTEIQSFYSPNFLARKVPGHSLNDYIRFIGRTYPIGFVNYASMIDGLNFSPKSNEYEGFYISTNYIDYRYTDTLSGSYNIGFITSFDSKAYVGNRAYVPVYTNERYFPLSNFTDEAAQKNYYNVTDASFKAVENFKFAEWGTEHELIKFKRYSNVVGPNHFNQIDKPDTVSFMWESFMNLKLGLGLYFVSYEKVLIKQYGGWDRSARYDNQYILANHFTPYRGSIKYQTIVENAVFGGDVYVNVFDYQKSMRNTSSGFETPKARDDQFDNQMSYDVALFFPCETRFNTELNLNSSHASTRNVETPIYFNNAYNYNAAYDQENTTTLFLSKAYLQTNVKEEPHTIYASERKLDNDQEDSWRKLLINNALSVNGNYGEINRVIQFKDKLYFYQNDAVGIAAIDERVLADEQQLGTISQTQLGVGDVLQRYDYISTETGSKHSFAVAASGSAIYHYDAFINKFFKLTFDDKGLGMIPLTDVEGLSGFFRTTLFNSRLKSVDKILYKKTATPGSGRVGITSEFNSEYNSVYFTFFDESDENSSKHIRYTISFNEMLDAFESFYDFFPSMYLNMRKRFMSIEYESSPGIQRNNKVYIHNIGFRNMFYGQVFPSQIKFRVNENSDIVKTFDNLHINSEVIQVSNNANLQQTVQQMEIRNDYQRFTKKPVNFTPKLRTWRIAIPRDETNPNLTILPRIADKYMDVLLEHSNTVPSTLDRIFRLHDVITEYSLRSKILPK